MSQAIPNKLYFKIGEVARLAGVEPHVLRYWETEFREIRPVKSRTNQRLYRRRDVETVLSIKRLLYDQGFTIEGARKKIREPVQHSLPFLGGVSHRLLRKIKGGLEDLLKHLEREHGKQTGGG